MRRNRGIAQILVLWALALLGTLALGFSWSMRTEAMAARNGIDETRAYFQARTGVDRVLKLLATLPPDNVLRMAIAESDGDASYEVRVESESGKVDINLVSEGVLLEILKKGGLPADEAESVRDAILDWKDADDTPRARGAEEPEYALSPEPARPRNGKILAIGELMYVKGVTPEFFRGFLARVFTANGNSPHVNFLRAPEAVLRSLPGVSPEAAARIVARRADDPPMTAAELAAMVGEGILTAEGLALVSGASASNVYSITAIGKAGGNVTQAVRCLAELSGIGGKGVKIRGWQENVSPEEGG